MIVLATIMYGANINLIKGKLYKYHPIVISALPLFFISIPGLIILFSSDVQHVISQPTTTFWRSVTAVFLLALFGNSLSLVLFNRLIQLSGPVFASSVTYFIPVVAMIWGLADGETVGTLQWIGLLLILGGIYLVNRRKTTSAQ